MKLKIFCNIFVLKLTKIFINGKIKTNGYSTFNRYYSSFL
jgi:hypothetical protein